MWALYTVLIWFSNIINTIAHFFYLNTFSFLLFFSLFWFFSYLSSFFFILFILSLFFIVSSLFFYQFLKVGAAILIYISPYFSQIFFLIFLHRIYHLSQFILRIINLPYSEDINSLVAEIMAVFAESNTCHGTINVFWVSELTHSELLLYYIIFYYNYIILL